MFRIVIEIDNMIRGMEVELEKLLKEKEQVAQLAIVPLTIVPILVTTTPGAFASTSATIDSTSELVRAMDDLSIKEHEMLI